MSGNGGKRRARRGILTTEDQALWDLVAARIQPLDRHDLATPGLDPADFEPPLPSSGTEGPDLPGGTPAKPGKRQRRPGPVQKPVPRPPPPPPSLSIDRRTLQGLRRGRTPIDARLDLHGHRQASAHAALTAFLQANARVGRRFVLVITGKGAPTDAGGHDDGDLPIPERRGVLRSAVPRWLREPALADLVVGIAAAGPLHGGSGALYIQLRRKGLPGPG